jgi:hypothetical protein
MICRYANRGGNGGVTYFEIGRDCINLWFKSDVRGYIYDRNRPGRAHVAQMQRLALAGIGLTTFVNQHVRGNYSGRTGPPGAKLDEA